MAWIAKFYSNISSIVIKEALILEKPHLPVRLLVDVLMASSKKANTSVTHSKNDIVLSFDVPSKKDVTKCKTFWKFIDSHPDLQKLKVLGRNQLKVLAEESNVVRKSCTPSTCPPRRMWTDLLKHFEDIGLDKVALASAHPKSSLSEIHLDSLEHTAQREEPVNILKEIEKFEKKKEPEFKTFHQAYKNPVTVEKFLEKRREQRKVSLPKYK